MIHGDDDGGSKRIVRVDKVHMVFVAIEKNTSMKPLWKLHPPCISFSLLHKLYELHNLLLK